MSIKVAVANIILNFEVKPTIDTINPPKMKPTILTLKTASGLPLQFCDLQNNIKKILKEELKIYPAQLEENEIIHDLKNFLEA